MSKSIILENENKIVAYACIDFLKNSKSKKEYANVCNLCVDTSYPSSTQLVH